MPTAYATLNTNAAETLLHTTKHNRLATTTFVE